MQLCRFKCDMCLNFLISTRFWWVRALWRMVNCNLLFIFVLFFCSGQQVVADCGDNTWGGKSIQRFVAVADGSVVKDRQTGLLWQRCSFGQVWVDGDCREQYTRQVQSWYSWEQAQKYLAFMQGRGEQQGWRLPTRYELNMLVDSRCGAPTINRKIFSNTLAGKFWTADELHPGSDYAWLVDFDGGSVSNELKTTSSYYVRTVKGEVLDELSTVEVMDGIQKRDDGIHDLSNPGLLLLQVFDEAVVDLPRDDRSNVDWARALREGLIQPRTERLGGGDQPVWDHNIVYTDTQTMPAVLFPHKVHSEWLSCENCHDDIFATKTFTADISMRSIYSGEHCGRCHGRVAFSPNSCERCHQLDE